VIGRHEALKDGGQRGSQEIACQSAARTVGGRGALRSGIPLIKSGYPLPPLVERARGRGCQCRRSGADKATTTERTLDASAYKSLSSSLLSLSFTHLSSTSRFTSKSAVHPSGARAASSPSGPPHVRGYLGASVALAVSAPLPTPPSGAARAGDRRAGAARRGARARPAHGDGDGVPAHERRVWAAAARRAAWCAVAARRGRCRHVVLGRGAGKNVAGAAHLCTSLGLSACCPPSSHFFLSRSVVSYSSPAARADAFSSSFPSATPLLDLCSRLHRHHDRPARVPGPREPLKWRQSEPRRLARRDTVAPAG
jgi:hypothetical protein